METNDIFQMLKACGFQEQHIKMFLNKMDGNDLIPVVNAAREKNIQFLDSLMKKYHILEWIQPFDSQNVIDQYLFISEGYNYKICIPTPKMYNDVLSWLIENDITFSPHNDSEIAIQCNPKQLTQTDNKINTLAAKYRFNKSFRVMKDNDIAGIRRTYFGDKNLKKKKTITKIDAIHECVVGDVIDYKGKKCSVKIPKGPHGTMGIVVDKKLRFIDRSELGLDI